MKFATRGLLLVVLSGFLLSACATTRNLSQINKLRANESGLKILLLPLDVELSSLQASGITETNAEWTTTAKRLMLAAIRTQQTERQIALVDLDPAKSNLSAASEQMKVQKLYRAVGQAIMIHKISPNGALPSKKDKFDWSVGPSAASLAEAYGTDYALFVFVRDSYTSAGRVALQVAAAMFGVGITGGAQVGYASLVDLKTGNVVWFNYLYDGYGDLRSESGATKAVAHLIGTMPK